MKYYYTTSLALSQSLYGQRQALPSSETKQIALECSRYMCTRKKKAIIYKSIKIKEPCVCMYNSIKMSPFRLALNTEPRRTYELKKSDSRDSFYFFVVWRPCDLSLPSESLKKGYIRTCLVSETAQRINRCVMIRKWNESPTLLENLEKKKNDYLIYTTS
ncbi:hypothetical protein OUZ56_021245 [Daphnia magna]|uniref:Uncharacterized protein n=1 Tax=Daphnia magna TaxID=35525 RepID=A0ABQ9ZGV3_9CRUS|nr:hypothetical protein OUZ56_021245 [Daphnia magna]